MLISNQIQNHVVANLDNLVKIVAVSTIVDDKQTVTFKCLKWMKLFNYVNSDGTSVLIDSYFNNEVTFSIEVPEQEFTMESVVRIPLPLFLNGTLSNTKFEWNKFELDEKSKLPFIWLVSPTQEVVNRSMTKRSQLRLWFVHWSDWLKLNADRQSEAIEPLMALVSEFVNTINRMNHIFESYDNYTLKDFPKFGTETPDGVNKVIFDSTLSAIEMNIDVNIFVNCCTKC